MNLCSLSQQLKIIIIMLDIVFIYKVQVTTNPVQEVSHSVKDIRSSSNAEWKGKFHVIIFFSTHSK